MRLCWILLVALFFVAAPARAYDIEVLRDHGPRTNRLNIVVLGDGYTGTEQVALSADADTVLAGLFANQPFADYATFFNATLIHVVSAESGADHYEDTIPIEVDTALDAHYGCFGQDTLLCVSASDALSIAASHVPDFDVVIVVVNDPAYGISGGQLSVVSRNFAGLPELAGHLTQVLGQSLANLATESEGATGYSPCNPISDCFEPNVTLRTDRAAIKWQHWIDAGTPLPTPESVPYLEVVGLFEGARYQSEDVFRPMQRCRMRTATDDFCPVCKEALILELYDHVSPIDATSPADELDLLIGEERTLSVTHAQTESGSVRVTWTIDGLEQAQTQNDLVIAAAALGGGDHVVTAQVADLTTHVRHDPFALLQASASWVLHITGCGDGEVQDPEECDGGDDCTVDCQLIDIPGGGDEPPNGDGEPHDEDDGLTNQGRRGTVKRGCEASGASPHMALVALACLVRVARARRGRADAH